MFRGFTFWTALFFAALGLGCQAASSDPLGAQASDDKNSEDADSPVDVQGSSAHEFDVTLTQTSQNPTPLGLPNVLSITATEEILAGLSVAATWAAKDGDAERDPRDGPATIELGSQGSELTIVLRAESAAAGSDESLTLSGTLDGSRIHGTFSDRLFFPRVGLFEGTAR